MFELIVIIMFVYGASSMWLFSPGPEKIREWWIKNTGKLAPLGYCQLCCSFWIALMPCYVTYAGMLTPLMLAIGISGLSWMLGAITNAFLWLKASLEYDFEQREKYDSN